MDPTDLGLFDINVLEASCSEDAFCAATDVVFGGPVSTLIESKDFPSVWLGVMSLYDSPAASTGKYAVSVTCDCQD